MDLSLFEKFAKTWESGEIIFLEFEPGDKFYFIQSGRVRICKVINDIEKTVDVLESGDLFGEMAILESQPRSASAIAEGRAKLLEFTRENFEMLISKTPALGLKLLKIFSKRIFDAKRRMMILQFDESELRVADCFAMFAEQANIPRDNYIHEQEFNATIAEVANWCGIHVNEAQRVITNYVKQGKIEVHDRRIIVKNLNELQRLVDSRRKKQK